MFTSIIITCRKSDEDVAMLLKDISLQESFSDYETVVIEGLYPPGRARNEGARRAKGEILVFIDKDIRLGSSDLLRRLLDIIQQDPATGIAIASIRIPKDANAFERRYARQIPLCQLPIVNEPTQAGTASAACFAIRKELFDSAGAFHEEMIRGEDSELSLRVKRSGKKIILAPQAVCYHHQPSSISRLIKTQMRNGVGVSFVDTYFPYLNIDVAPDRFDYDLRRKGFFERLFRYVTSLYLAMIKGKVLLLFSKMIYAASYIYGRIKFSFQKILQRKNHSLSKSQEAPTSLLITYDFPPIVSGIGTFFFNVWKGLPPHKYIILAPNSPGYKVFDNNHTLNVKRYFTFSNIRIARFIFLLVASLGAILRKEINILFCGVPVTVGSIGWIF
ncbi:MAG: glycosyltransferase, partial [Candidatus Omnitrophota bacterium]